MFQLLYVSNTARDVPQTWLDSILASSRRNNVILGVTGVLLHADGGFLQILEGEKSAVLDIYTKIAADKRHWNAHKLLQLEAPRAFADWSMGFQKVIKGGNDEMFEISSAAIHGHLTDSGAKVLLRLVENFYRIQTGLELQVRDPAAT